MAYKIKSKKEKTKTYKIGDVKNPSHPSNTPIYYLEDPEGNGLTPEETQALWQYGVDTGIVWRLQGWYGRNAQALLDEGYIHYPKKHSGQSSTDYYGNKIPTQKEVEKYKVKQEEEKKEPKEISSTGMKRTIGLYNQKFESSSSETPQFREFFNSFRHDFSYTLKKQGAKNIEFHKGHFEVSGFFTAKDGKIYYFNTGDVRWGKGSMLIRTAKNYKDYTGGSNQSISFDDNFEKNLFRIIKK